MDSGTTLAAYYAADAMRLVEMGAANPDIMLAEQLVRWLHEKWPGELISLPDVYQRGPSAIREKRTADRIVGILADHGWLVTVEGGANIDGVHRQNVWRIVEA